jgi:hypothetical protein
MQSSTLSLLIICGVFVILVGMVALAVYLSSKETLLKQKIATSLGFSPVTNTQVLVERLAFVTGRSRPDLLRVTHVFRRAASGSEIYWYSLHRREIKGSTLNNPSKLSKIHYHPLELDAFAFTTPSWKFPRFVITPRLPGQGWMENLANTVGEKLVEASAQRLEFPQIPGLDEKYFVAVYDQPLPTTFREGLLRILADTPGLHVGGNGNTLTVSLSSQLSHTEQDIQQLYKTALQLARQA